MILEDRRRKIGLQPVSRHHIVRNDNGENLNAEEFDHVRMMAGLEFLKKQN